VPSMTDTSCEPHMARYSKLLNRWRVVTIKVGKSTHQSKPERLRSVRLDPATAANCRHVETTTTTVWPRDLSPVMFPVHTMSAKSVISLSGAITWLGPSTRRCPKLKPSPRVHSASRHPYYEAAQAMIAPIIGRCQPPMAVNGAFAFPAQITGASFNIRRCLRSAINAVASWSSLLGVLT
jgi:hypothetical protein